ncbi:MAG: alpha/beta fold hydrolase [Anaerolineae bacterium]|nr:alpha/beta fold hydrolase [Anaerolineae bacterium]
MNIGAVLDSIASAEISHASERLELFRRDIWIPDPEGDDVRLSILDVYPDNPMGVIVLLHGFAASTKWWQPQIPALSCRYRVIAIDERGCGLSSRPSSGYSFEQLADDTAAVLDQLGIDEPVVVGGHSTGGAVVVEFALRHPHRVAKLVIIATPVSFADSGIVRSAGRIMKMPDFLFRWAQPFYELDPRGEASLLGLKQLFQNGLLTWDGHDKLPKVTHKTLFIRGERDRVFSHESYAVFADLLPNAEMVDIGVSKHQIPLERPQAVVRLMERFLEPDEVVRKQPGWRRNMDGVAGLPLLVTRPWIARYAESVPHNIDPIRISLSQMLAYTVRNNGDATAWQYRRERMQYKGFAAQVRSVAAGLRAQGVGSGARVYLWLPNTPHFLVALYAVQAINAVAVLGDVSAALEQIQAQIEITDARWLITMNTLQDSAETLRTTTDLEKIIIADYDDYGERRQERRQGRRKKVRDEAKTTHDEPLANSHIVTWRELVLMKPETQPESFPDPDSTAVILFTPDSARRGIQLSHTNLVTTAVQMVDWTQALELRHGSIMSAVPFSTAIGLTLGVNLAVHAASRIDLFPEADRELFLRAMWLWKPSIVVSTPHTLKGFSEFPGLAQFVASPGPVFLSTGAPLPLEKQEVFERLSHARVVECYGMSETAAVTHCNPLQRNRTGSVGLPLPGVEAEVRDLQSGEPQSFFHVGELVVRGPQVMCGYLDHDATGSVYLEDGWLATGDIAEIDDDGYFYILGRCSALHRTPTGDLIIPRDIEEVLIELPEVDDVAVLSQPEGLLACLVTVENNEISAEILRAFCSERLPENHVPYQFRFVQHLPRNYAGRLLDDELRRQLDVP